MMLENLFFLLVSCAVLVKSADVMVKSIGRIAIFFNMSGFAISFVLIAFATSIPELSIGIASAIEKTPEIVIGNVIGSNVANATMIMGIVALLARRVGAGSNINMRDTMHIFAIMAVPIILMLNGKLERIDGIVLLAVFLWYSMWLITKDRKISKVNENGGRDGVSVGQLLWSVLALLASLAILFVSADFIIRFAKEFSTEIGLPLILISLFLISFGTTLPELTFGVRAAFMGRGDMAIGDTLGTLVANSTVVLGVSALIAPIELSGGSFLLFITSAFFMLTAGFIFLTFLGSEEGLTWREGIGLIMLYTLFILVMFTIETVSIGRVGVV
ncbi:MAG: hypothetical protein MSIBF_00815 [Candidatus Altiarchaeales archaeon IMC4]|nr:MAG: hypothetical protein MSIBF_00815 [Candidatus Altiarchaeales archaeon IMC4]